MGYYLRAFCTKPTVPPLADVIGWTRKKGCPVQIDPEAVEEGPDAANWLTQQVPVRYKQGNNPFLVQVDRKGGEDSGCETEIGEFLEFLEDVDDSRAKNKVIKHLNSTRFTVACQLLTSDIDDDGYNAVGWFMAYFPKHCGGMVQADGEGFYKGNKLIVELG
jgi:hypothetical protein